MFSARGFREWAGRVVLFLHVTSRVKNEPYAELHRTKGFAGFPALAFLDEKGNVLFRQRDRTLSGLELTLRVLTGYRASREEGSTAAERLLAEMRIGRTALADAKGRVSRLKDVSPKLRASLAQEVINLEVASILARPEAKNRTSDAVGEELYAFAKRGRVPRGTQLVFHPVAFWLKVVPRAVATKDWETVSRAVAELRSEPVDDPAIAKLLQRWEKLLAGARKREPSDTSDGEFEALMTDIRTLRPAFEARVRAYSRKIQDAGSDTKRLRALRPEAKELSKSNPIHVVGPKIIDLARRRPASSGGRKAMTWIILQYPAPSATMQMIADSLAAHHARADGLDEALLRLIAPRGFKSERLFRAVLAKNPHRSTRAVACYALAQQLLNKSRATTPAAETEGLLLRLRDDYSDVAIKKGTLAAEYANRALFEVRRLQIGMKAPDIEGEDVDGVRFKLSDYRGKVVLLDFWGDW